MRAALFLARKELRYLLRERESAFWIFLLPVVFFGFFGRVMGGFEPTGGPTRLVVERPAGAGLFAARAAQRLEAEGFELVPEGPGGPGGPEAPADAPRLVFPARFSERVLAGDGAAVELVLGSAGPAAEFDRFRATKAVYGTLADLLACQSEGVAPSAAAFDALDRRPRALVLDARPAGERQVIPTGYEQAVPGILVMFTLMALLTSGAVMLLVEREQGLLRRLASTPIPRGQIVLGKWLGKWLIGLAQLAFGMAAGSLLFGMQWGPNLPMVAVVLAVWAAFAASLGLLAGSLARSEGQAVGIGVLATNLLAALGGCWWPIEVTPDWMQRLAAFLPTGWAMEAMHRLISFGRGPASVLPQLALLLVATLAAGWIAARRFRFD